MSLRTISHGMFFFAGLGLSLTSFITYAEVKTDVSAEVVHPQKDPQQQLLTLSSHYQKICSSDECAKQLKQLKMYGRWGDPKAQLVLGTAYLYGDGVKQSADKAISWLKRAAYNDAPKYSLKAYHIMAKLYQQGIGVEQDLELANKYFNKLADKHYGPVLFDRAFIEFEQNNLTQGITLLEQASESRYPEASYFLARMYQQGEFVEQDINKAAIFYQKIVRKDYKDSRQQLELIVAEMEESSTAHTATNLAQEQSLLKQLHATLNIEVITVSSYSIETKDAMTNLIAKLTQNRSSFIAATGSRIKGLKCGQTSNDCKGWTAEDIEDAINAGLVD